MRDIKKKKKEYEIEFTRGDYFATVVGITVDGEKYTPEEGDTLRFAMKHNTLKPDGSDYTDAEPLLDINIPTETCLLEIQSSDTKELAFGEYAFDIQLTKPGALEGKPDTIIVGIVKLTKEVD